MNKLLHDPLCSIALGGVSCSCGKDRMAMPKAATRAGEILRQAADAVDGPRNSQHGDKERSFECIAEGWEWYLKHRPGGVSCPVTDKDVAAMMVLLKLARFLYGEPIADHFMDMAGYAGIMGELAEGGAADLPACGSPNCSGCIRGADGTINHPAPGYTWDERIGFFKVT